MSVCVVLKIIKVLFLLLMNNLKLGNVSQHRRKSMFQLHSLKEKYWFCFVVCFFFLVAFFCFCFFPI